ncbi:hypothetical protein [uncultured Mediterranean phage uvMED]|nr:hypothetical protein [uncultured Mediterranean phage uvMED]BAR22604.1 hypothetical protein [uncultured Mediterranean phage uvMED]
MKLKEAIEVLQKHQEWRRDKSFIPKSKIQSPSDVGRAIDYALKELKKLKAKRTKEN